MSPLVKVTVEAIPSSCWKCKGRLVRKDRGLYCPNCSRFRKYLQPPSLHWSDRGGRQISYVDVRESGRQKQRVMLKGHKDTN